MFVIIFCSLIILISLISFFFFFNDTATTEIYTLSLHDALPILDIGAYEGEWTAYVLRAASVLGRSLHLIDRKSTRLNSSHLVISYAVFCLKKKKKNSKPCTFYNILHLIVTRCRLHITATT